MQKQTETATIGRVASSDWRKYAEHVLNEVTGQKLKAFNWIQEGMCSVH